MATARKYSRGADYVVMSDDDYDAVKKAGESWATASKAGDQAGMQAAHDRAESIRAKYGYSGGADGSGYQKNQSQDQAPAYISRYQSQLNDALDRYLNRESFSYDPETDPSYQQLKDQYTRNGQRAMEDTLGQISARTGGLASSYAGAAAQQTYDGYMAELADRVPQLRQLAYQMYLDEGNQLKDRVGLLQGLENNDYGRYQDQLGQWNTDRSFQYNVGRDQIADSRYADETAWNRGKYNEETEYSRAMEKAKTLAAAGDFSGYKALGYTDQDVATMKEAYDREQSLKAYLARKSSGGGTPTTGTEFAEDGIVEGDYDALFQRASQSYDPENFISTFKDQFGFKYSTGLYDAYLRWVENGGASTNVSFDYDPDEGVFTLNGQQYTATGDLEAAIKDLGLTKGQLGALMDKVDANTVYKGWSQNGRNLLNQIKKIPGLTDENKVAMVNDAFEKGRISEYDVDLILKRLGYGG